MVNDRIYDEDRYINNKIWNVALYVRLSKEDGDKEESDSIKNQKDLLLNYVETKLDLKVYGIFVDDGYSGTNFDRPGFEKMMDAVKSKNIDCVIVKDLSRLGRNYIEVGKYIEQIFPFMDIRFISVNDGLDSFDNPNQINSIIVPFKNLINDEYCRDISMKIRSSFESKRKKGEFIGAFAAYGYLKSPENKNKLIVDEYAAGVVQDIFKWFLEGMSKLGIVSKLDELGMLPPLEYKKSIGLKLYLPRVNDNMTPMWSVATITRILENELYIGNMVQKKTTIRSYKIKKQITLPKKDWIIVENTHEPIIEKEVFLKVQDLLKRNTRTMTGKKYVHIFSGFIKCADCGRAMTRQKNNNNFYYVCATYKMHSKCSSHCINCKLVEEAVLTTIQKHVGIAVSFEKIIKTINKSPTKNNNINKIVQEISRKEKELYRVTNIKRGLYEDWKNKYLTKEEFLDLKKNYANKIHNLNKIIDNLKDEKIKIREKLNTENIWIINFKKHKNIDKLTREIVVELIDEIIIHKNHRITIKFKFADEYERLAEYSK